MMSFLRVRCGYTRDEVGRSTIPEVTGLMEDLPFIDPDFARSEADGAPPKKPPKSAADAVVADRGGIRM